MEQKATEEIRHKMKQALILIREAVDLSITLAKQDGKQQIKALWEGFIREFIRYTRQKSRETGVDLISLVSLARIMR